MYADDRKRFKGIQHLGRLYLSAAWPSCNVYGTKTFGSSNYKHIQRPVSQKILSPLVILSMEKTMVTKVIRELKSVSRLKILPETGPRCLFKRGRLKINGLETIHVRN